MLVAAELLKTLSAKAIRPHMGSATGDYPGNRRTVYMSALHGRLAKTVLLLLLLLLLKSAVLQTAGFRGYFRCLV